MSKSNNNDRSQLKIPLEPQWSDYYRRLSVECVAFHTNSQLSNPNQSPSTTTTTTSININEQTITSHSNSIHTIDWHWRYNDGDYTIKTAVFNLIIAPVISDCYPFSHKNRRCHPSAIWSIHLIQQYSTQYSTVQYRSVLSNGTHNIVQMPFYRSDNHT